MSAANLSLSPHERGHHGRTRRASSSAVSDRTRPHNDAHTLATAPRTRYGAASKPSRSAGFTLIEILAVVALIALALTVVSVSVGSGLAGARVKSASRDLVAALRYTRGQAIVKREEKTLSIDVEQRRYRAVDKDWVELPKGMTLDLLTTRDELEEEGVGRIRFFPDGSSTGGHVDLIHNDVVWRVQVQWLTGEVKLHENLDTR